MMKFLSKSWPYGVYVHSEDWDNHPFTQAGYLKYENIRTSIHYSPKVLYREPGDSDLVPYTKLHKLLEGYDRETSSD